MTVRGLGQSLTEYCIFIHIHMSNEQLKYDSKNMQNYLKLINEVDNFIKTSLPIKNGAYILLGIEIKTLPEEDKTLLNEWKSDSIRL